MRKFTFLKWIPLIGICLLTFIFSCTEEFPLKDLSLSEKQSDRYQNTELTKSVAKQWYESNYKPVVTTRANYDDSIVNMMKPDWKHAKEFNRQRYEVVEMPILVKGASIILDAETAQKWTPETKDRAIRNTAKIVIERDKRTGQTRAFVMIFVGSYNYLKKTKTMGQNTYLYREPDFDGSVLFYELNGTFVNGWAYKEGKITACISPKLPGETEEKIPQQQTRAMIEDCHDECYTVVYQECYSEGWAEPDPEFGFGFGSTSGCYPVYTEECTTYCDYYDDGSDTDENWNGEYPSGGSNTPQTDEAYQKTLKERQELFNKSIKIVKTILANIGVDIDKYKIVFKGENCSTNGAILSDGTITICNQALNLTYYDLASVVWHEIYHFEHNHYKNNILTFKFSTPYVIQIDDEVRPYYECVLEQEFGGAGYIDPTFINDFLVETCYYNLEWYANEIEAYSAELNNGIQRTFEYESVVRYNLWKMQHMYNYLTSELNKK